MYKKNQRVELESVSNDLHDALINKSANAFWKTWKNKFGKKRNNPVSVEGLVDDHDIANKFAQYFADVCKLDLSVCNVRLSQEFDKRLADYYTALNDKDVITIDVELIDSVVKNLKKGKAAGIDRLTSEHVQFSHPIIISLLSMLFNLMIKYEFVPDSFGVGIIIPIPKNDSSNNFSKVSDYRGITVSPVISKLFELCIVENIKYLLRTSDAQFGFKSGIGCNHAIYSARSIINYCTTNNSTVNLCSLDISKAFDKINHFAIFSKLMDRQIPRNLISLLANWYSKNFAVVRWNTFLSHSVKMFTGVRQGGILSPYLFAILVDDILIKLKKSGLGCRMHGLIFNAIMYADDLLLLSISVTDLQAMVKLCASEFNEIGLSLNMSKSVCMRIGSRFNLVKHPVSNISVGVEQLKWKAEIKYLGVTFLSAAVFKCNLQIVRQKFFRSLNGIFGKIGTRSSIPVTLSLICTYCVPLLTYAIESINVTRSVYNVLDNAYMAALFKIFGTYDKSVIGQCQFYCKTRCLTDIIDIRRLRFLQGIKNCNNLSVNFLFSISGTYEFADLLTKHSLIEHNSGVWKRKMWSNFVNSCDMCFS